MVKHLKNTKEFKELISTKVLVDFYAEWCGPCQMLAPNLEKLEVDVVKVDIDEFRDLAIEYGVMSVPTLITFNNSKEISTLVGYQELEDLNKLCRDLK